MSVFVSVWVTSASFEYHKQLYCHLVVTKLGRLNLLLLSSTLLSVLGSDQSPSVNSVNVLVLSFTVNVSTFTKRSSILRARTSKTNTCMSFPAKMFVPNVILVPKSPASLKKCAGLHCY